MASIFKRCRVCERRFIWEKGCQFCKRMDRKYLRYLIWQLPETVKNPQNSHEKRMT